MGRIMIKGGVWRNTEVCLLIKLFVISFDFQHLLQIITLNLYLFSSVFFRMKFLKRLL